MGGRLHQRDTAPRGAVAALPKGRVGEEKPSAGQGFSKIWNQLGSAAETVNFAKMLKGRSAACSAGRVQELS